jgi:hypothetical protein
VIIGLTGKKGAGKDTVADYLVEHYGFQKVGFSDALYEAVCGLWGVSLEQALEFKQTATVGIRDTWDEDKVQLIRNYTWREFLQRFGTEMGRAVFGEDFWIEVFEDRYLEPGKILGEDHNFVVRDVRFNNEAEMLYDYVAEIWCVQRPDMDDGDDHASESGIDEKWIRGDIGNDGTIEELHILLDEWMLAAYGSRTPRRS